MTDGAAIASLRGLPCRNRCASGKVIECEILLEHVCELGRCLTMRCLTSWRTSTTAINVESGSSDCFRRVNTCHELSLWGRVHPVARDRFRVTQPQGQLWGGELGSGWVMCRPVADFRGVPSEGRKADVDTGAKPLRSPRVSRASGAHCPRINEPDSRGGGGLKRCSRRRSGLHAH